MQPGEVVTVVLTLHNLDASEIAQSIAPMLSNAGTVVPLSRGRGLIVTDYLANIKHVRDLLAEVDTASPAQREMRSYTLRNASGAVLMDMINRTFGVATAPRRVEFNQQTKTYHHLPPDAADYVTAVFDDASRTLVLFGPADRLGLAETLIKQFEDKSGVQAGEVNIFYPQSTSAQELARMLHQAMPSVAERGRHGGGGGDQGAAGRGRRQQPADCHRPGCRAVGGDREAGQTHRWRGGPRQRHQPFSRSCNFRTAALKALSLKYTSATSLCHDAHAALRAAIPDEDPRLRVLATASNDDKTLLVEATPRRSSARGGHSDTGCRADPRALRGAHLSTGRGQCG